ncbi:hypothetical protein niasHT_021616 [Heterodera trifolii]|uniref:Uncharacterized protein n=1 Tax=Heterodera trifolii TaxID=157864 RepID=A0ABD2JBP1_9BILA
MRTKQLLSIMNQTTKTTATTILKKNTTRHRELRTRENSKGRHLSLDFVLHTNDLWRCAVRECPALVTIIEKSDDRMCIGVWSLLPGKHRRYYEEVLNSASTNFTGHTQKSHCDFEKGLSACAVWHRLASSLNTNVAVHCGAKLIASGILHFNHWDKPTNIPITGTQPTSISITGTQFFCISITGTQFTNIPITGTQSTSISITGTNPPTFQSLGLNPPAFQLPGLNSSEFQSLGLNPPTFQSLGLNPPTFQAPGLNPPTFQSPGLNLSKFL